MHKRRGCFTYLLLGFIWLYVIFKSRARFRVNLHSIVAWISRNFLLKTEIMLQPLGIIFDDIFGPKKNDLFCPVFVFHRGKHIGIIRYIPYFKNEGLNISSISRYNSILRLKNGFHSTVFYSVLFPICDGSILDLKGKFRHKQIYFFWVFWS